MMKLKCLAPYESGVGRFRPGQVIEESDEVCEFLLRDSPGTFEAIEVPIESAPDLGAISEETATGLVVPDRRMRGGRRR